MGRPYIAVFFLAALILASTYLMLLPQLSDQTTTDNPTTPYTKPVLNPVNITEAYNLSDDIASGADPELVTANTRFALKLMRELQSEDPDGNVFTSPLSISIALAMTYNGAGGSTRDAMVRALELENISHSDINSGYLRLLDSLMSLDDNASVGLSDSIWVKNAYAPVVKTTYTGTLRDYFGSSLYIQPFDQSTVNEVNGWVSNSTRGRIQNMVESLDPNVVMLLINAIHFYGNWTRPFAESDSYTMKFTLSNGTVVSTPAVSSFGSLRTYDYYGDDTVGMIRLPYGRGRFSMYVLLPSSGANLASFMDSLTKEELDGYLSKMSERKLDFAMPKLNLAYGVKDVSDALTKMGMGEAFDPNTADFSGITGSRGLWLGFVYHKAVIRVDEKGSEAAAGTVVGHLYSAPPRFVVDRPYMFMIRDDVSGSILFMGAVMDPTQK